jgi:3-oxoacyl-[acyl-carrier protein] reductase
VTAGPLSRQVAVVTGASKGIGEATAIALARAGATMVAAGRTEGEQPGSVAAVVARARALGGDAEGVIADVRREADVDRLFEVAENAYGGVDILVNNAGVFYIGMPLAEQTLAEWDEMMAVNLRGIFLCCRAAVRLMTRRGGGSIVNLTSNAAEAGRSVPGMAAYAASKAAVERFTQVLAQEISAANIAVNAIAPNRLVTPGTIARDPPEWVATYEPVEVIGDVMVHLASCRAEFTGHTVNRLDFVAGRFAAVR